MRPTYILHCIDRPALVTSNWGQKHWVNTNCVREQ